MKNPSWGSTHYYCWTFLHVEHAVWLPPTERKRHNNEPLKSRLCGLSVSQHLIRFICHLFVVMTMRRLAGDKRETRRVFMVSLKATRETEIVVIRLLRYANHRQDIAVRSFKSLKITRDLRTIVLPLLCRAIELPKIMNLNRAEVCYCNSSFWN